MPLSHEQAHELAQAAPLTDGASTGGGAAVLFVLGPRVGREDSLRV